MNYKDAKKMLGSREVKKLRYATFLHNREDHFAIRHHATDIVRIYPRKVVFDCNGWKSKTTKERLNDYGPGTVWSQKGVWMVSYNGSEALYKDGMTFHSNGAITGGESVSEEKKQIQLRKEIK